MLEVTSLGSGSCGNALLLRSQQQTLLVDCGVGVGPLTRGLSALGLRLDEIDVVLLTHEHIDHIRELPGLLRRMVRPNDMVICLGAGTSTEWAHALPGLLDADEPRRANA